MIIRQESTRTNQLIEALQNRTKIHAITHSQNWQKGYIIQIGLAKHIISPRPSLFTTQLVRCTSIEPINIVTHGIDGVDIRIGYNLLNKQEHIDLLIKNEGYKTLYSFIHDYVNNPTCTFEGFIVHWTDFRYESLFTNKEISANAK